MRRSFVYRMFNTACAAIFLLACFGLQAQGGEPASFTITSPAFLQMGDMHSRYTCQGEDISPQLNFAGLPEGTKTLVLIVDDPDAPNPKAPKMIWVHWLLYNLPSGVKGLAEAVSELPSGTLEGENDWHRTGYGGPCPPVGRHRYFFKLFALDTLLSDLGEPSKATLEVAMHGHVLARTELIGTYEKF